jgi:hypothetical protein
VLITTRAKLPAASCTAAEWAYPPSQFIPMRRGQSACGACDRVYSIGPSDAASSYPGTALGFSGGNGSGCEPFIRLWVSVGERGFREACEKTRSFSSALTPRRSVGELRTKPGHCEAPACRSFRAIQAPSGCARPPQRGRGDRIPVIIKAVAGGGERDAVVLGRRRSPGWKLAGARQRQRSATIACCSRDISFVS